MRFQTALQDLTTALNTVAPAMNMGASDLTGHFVFRKHPTDATKIEVLTHEADTEASCPFVGEILQDGPMFTAPGKGLMTFLAVLEDEHSDEMVIFDFDAASATVKVTPASNPKRAYPFESRDPNLYKWFDQSLKDAKSVGSLAAGRLKVALTAAKGFMASEETLNPAFTVCEFQEGLLRATTGTSLLYVNIPGTEGATLRLQIKQHLAGALSFLGASKTENVEMLEVPDRMFFMRRVDGAVFGWTYYHNGLPLIAKPRETDDLYWKISAKALKNGIKAVLAGAVGTDVRAIQFTRSSDTGPIYLKASTDGKHRSEWTIPCEESGGDLNNTPIDFWLTYDLLQSLLSALASDEIHFGVNQKGKKGYVRVKDVRGEGAETDTFLFMLSWYQNAQRK